MLRIFCTMLVTGEVYRDSRTDCEALMVRRNAPFWIAILKKHGINPTTRAVAA